MEEDKEVYVITAYSSKVKSMFVVNDLFFSGQEGEEGIIKVWDIKKFTLVRVLQGHHDTVQMITGLN